MESRRTRMIGLIHSVGTAEIGLVQRRQGDCQTEAADGAG